jgi:hypothetical protein
MAKDTKENNDQIDAERHKIMAAIYQALLPRK